MLVMDDMDMVRVRPSTTSFSCFTSVHADLPLNNDIVMIIIHFPISYSCFLISWYYPPPDPLPQGGPDKGEPLRNK